MFQVIEVSKHPIRQPRWVNGRRQGTGRTQNHKTRIFFWPEGESIFEQLTTRHIRPSTQWKKMIPTVCEKLGVDASKVNAHWSSKAGCSMCPCSPGFVIDGWVDGIGGHDIHVKVSPDPMMVR